MKNYSSVFHVLIEVVLWSVLLLSVSSQTYNQLQRVHKLLNLLNSKKKSFGFSKRLKNVELEPKDSERAPALCCNHRPPPCVKTSPRFQLSYFGYFFKTLMVSLIRREAAYVWWRTERTTGPSSSGCGSATCWPSSPAQPGGPDPTSWSDRTLQTVDGGDKRRTHRLTSGRVGCVSRDSAESL